MPCRYTLGSAVLLTLLAGCGYGVTHRSATAGSARVHEWQVPSAWPPLPTTGYIRGRVATAADVTAGNAVFAACVGVAGRALRVAIPQYALWHDSATGAITPVIVVEAELFDGDSMFGLRQIHGGADAMATVADLELLGQAPGPGAGVTH